VKIYFATKAQGHKEKLIFFCGFVPFFWFSTFVL